MIFEKGELFCGPGGLTLGAKLAEVKDSEGNIFKVNHKWAVDYDEDTCETFRHNICPENRKSVICADVRRLKLNLMPEIDCFAFGFPCNDFSIVGESKGLEGEFGPLYSYGIKVLRYKRPKWFIAENVGGLESANDGMALIQILKEMKNAGYNITPHKYKFEEYGVPQARHRIIIVGIRNDINLKFKVPKAPYKNKNEWTSARSVLEMAIPNDAPNNEQTKHTKQVIERLSIIKPGDNAWAPYIPEKYRLNVKSAKMSNIYKRLDPDAPAYTVTGSGGGGTHMYHYAEPRALTSRERARLQTFPDDFKFIGGSESVRAQVGMAVPVYGAKIIVEAILNTFAGNEYPSEPARWDEEEIRQMIETGKQKKKRTGKGKTKSSQKQAELVPEVQEAFEI
ncbi:DNA (cytosine-5-)-methyltransferase [Bacillus sp. AFS002410]|uniref:DNA cytosine methyltransferase n=1 Tax=Bacillus sp. AFS002410 TaxID=2033481 RepID=UPI000BF05149|nr:DNA cytosine methyltransferase [Bacillus sp. AFS002410]PEJ58836.1 DNA (cytosine-5-)-methyltransferase [Bacillus sp. AFS002410]